MSSWSTMRLTVAAGTVTGPKVLCEESVYAGIVKPVEPL
jgi:hypothetical protein